MPKHFSWSADTVTSRLASIKKRIETDDPALRSVFTQVFFEDSRLEPSNSRQPSDSLFHGALVAVKDLFDVKGFVTKAGTKFMADDAPADTNAPPVAKLIDAGAIMVGHTNMTELAYSGLGLNPHYGTPENALLPGCIPGGSTSGGAVSVAHGITDLALGTDTGGSLRIPAAFNGIVGFKPTQGTVSREGCKALSRSLDSVGPMAKSVAVCDLAYRTIANDISVPVKTVEKEFIVPANYGMDDLQAPVRRAFEEVVDRFKDSGYKVRVKSVEALDELKSLATWHFSAIESRGEYEHAYQTKRDMIDPRVAGPTRMGRADEVDAVSYRMTLNLRQKLIVQYRREMGSKVLLMPTVPIMPPSFISLEDDAEYSRVNLQVLRNPSIANVMDCCSISLPFTRAKDTIGVMLTAGSHHDLSLLDLAAGCETVLCD